MTDKEAIDILLDIASRWGENVEEGFANRVNATDSDETCKLNATKSEVELEEVIEVRNLWRACEIMNAKQWES
jgi:hypothetical protein